MVWMEIRVLGRWSQAMMSFLRTVISLSSLTLFNCNISSDVRWLFPGVSSVAIRSDSGNRLQKLSVGFWIEIDSDHCPRQLKTLLLFGNNNNINAERCRELAKLLRGEMLYWNHLTWHIVRLTTRVLQSLSLLY